MEGCIVRIHKTINVFLFIVLILATTLLTAEAKKKSSKKEVESKQAVNKQEESIDGSRYILNCAECHGFDGNSMRSEWPSMRA